MIGKYVTSKAGHDKGKLYVVAACEEGYVYQVDGEYRRMDDPKKKKLKHVQLINEMVEQELLTQIDNRQPHIDDAIKYAIKKKLKTNKVEE